MLYVVAAGSAPFKHFSTFFVPARSLLIAHTFVKSLHYYTHIPTWYVLYFANTLHFFLCEKAKEILNSLQKSEEMRKIIFNFENFCCPELELRM